VIPAAAAHVFVDDLARPVLAADDRHHLERVLRLRAGETVTVSDGRGAWCTARFGPQLEPTGEVGQVGRPDPLVTVAFAVPKGDRPEWLVQKCTELGADVLVPLVTARSVVRWDPDRATRQVARLARVAREAAMQSRRAWLPSVQPVAPVTALAHAAGAAAAEPGGDPPTLRLPTVLVGPEGGWAPGELPEDLPRIGLGPNVLRTETAAVLAVGLLATLRAGFITESDATQRHV
jgi:16S rRNA (uracil1498-N3)-methyltransferase